MSRQDRLNKLFHQSLSTTLNQNFPLKDVLITIKRVDLSPNLALGQVEISVLPLNLAGSTLQFLRKNSKQLSFQASRKIKLRQVPKLNWQIDPSDQELAELDKIFAEIEEERKKDKNK